MFPGMGKVAQVMVVRLSRDPSKRKTFKKQFSDATDNFKDKVYRRNNGLHYGPKTYGYYFTWRFNDLQTYCHMLGLDYRKPPCKTTVAAATAFVVKHGSKKTIEYTVGVVPYVNSCIDATFNRYDLVKMIIEHLEKWGILEDFCPKSKDEWETFTKVHAEIAETKSTAYEGSAPWTNEQAEVFLQRLRQLHVKDLLVPMRLCDMFGAGVTKKLPTSRQFRVGNMDDSPFLYSYFRRGLTGSIFKALYGGSRTVCEKAVKALREVNVPFDLAYNVLTRRSEFKRMWGDYIRSVFVAARQQYTKRPEPYDAIAYQEHLDKRKAVEAFIKKRREERRLKRIEDESGKKTENEAAAGGEDDQEGELDASAAVEEAGGDNNDNETAVKIRNDLTA